MIFRSIFLVLIAFFISSCSKKELKLEGDTELLFKVEERNFTDNKIVEYRVHDNGLLLKTILFDGLDQDDDEKDNQAYITKFINLKKRDLDKAEKYLDKLEDLTYHNFFPWKEDIEYRGDVVKIDFIKEIEAETFSFGSEDVESETDDVSDESKESDRDDLQDIKAPVTYLYYTQHDESPPVFAEILAFVKDKSHQ